MTDKERGISGEGHMAGVPLTERRDTPDHLAPASTDAEYLPSIGLGRYVMYRYEDTAKRLSTDKEGRKKYPFWAPVNVSPGEVAPDRQDVGAGIVRFKAEPDWQVSPEAPLSQPPLIAAPRRPPPPAPRVDSSLEKPEPKPPAAEPKPLICPPGWILTKS